MKNLKQNALLPLAIAAGIFVAGSAQAEEPQTTYDAPVSISINLGYHTQMDMAEQDVFIERETGSGEVYRVTKADQDWSAPLYRAADVIEHNPFDGSDVGPYPKGKALGLTLGDWYSAEGKGSYTCVDGRGEIDLEFNNLVSDGVYTIWHAFVAMPPTTPFIGTYDLPIGARDGSESVFFANNDGKAQFTRSFAPCLQMTGEHLAGMLALNWHSDSKTYGVLPGAFATDAHIQLFTLLPKRTGL